MEKISPSRLTLLILFIAYLIWWIIGNQAMLFNPQLQNSDARTHVYTFHSYSGNEAIADDPIAAEVLGMVTPGIRGLYWTLVPTFGVLVSTKIVQAIIFSLLLLPVVLVLKAQEDKFIYVVLMVFFVLHSRILVGQMVGGFQRNFAIPVIVIWCTGAYLKIRIARYLAILLGMLTYPIASALTMGAEFLWLLINLDWLKRPSLVPTLKKELFLYVVLLLACITVVIPYMMMKSSSGPAHSLEQARNEPAFSMQGRIKALPFPSPFKLAKNAISWPFIPFGRSISKVFKDEFKPFNTPQSRGLLFFALAVMLLVLLGRKNLAIPKVTVCLFLASISLYILARYFAFHLYQPSRYFMYGLSLASVSLLTELAASLKLGKRTISNYSIAIIFIISSMLFLGDGYDPKLGVDLDGRKEAKLYQYFRSTPQNTRILCHPLDGDNIPLFTGRPTTGGIETLQPWFVDSWQRHKKFTTQVLYIMYATNISDVIAFCKNEGITHLLLNRHRYGPGYRGGAHMFEPFGAMIHKHLADKQLTDLALYQVLKSYKPTFTWGRYTVIEFKALLEAGVANN